MLTRLYAPLAVSLAKNPADWLRRDSTFRLMGMPVEATLSVGQIAVARSGLVEYETALQIQRNFHAEIVANRRPNTLILLEHPSVYTAGRRTAISDRPVDNTPVVDVDRGGKITWHGPGQLVGYPIVRLANRLEVVGYVRQLETALIKTCQNFGLATTRYPDRSGVWLRDEKGDRKIAAIGIRVAKGVTMHGFALNVCPDLSGFNQIVPCGIADAEVTSMSHELQRDITIAEVTPILERELFEVLTKVSA
jgi:lipoyl(octanoyl) transferase